MKDDSGGATSARVAEILVSTGAVTFRTEPFFTFTSGVQSPIYVDNRVILGHVRERSIVIRELTHAATELGVFDSIAGTATAGIPWASWLAVGIEVPLLYVRAEAKRWGHQKSVEGASDLRGRVLIVEDLVFSSGSMLQAVSNIREAGYNVDRCIAIVSYETRKATDRLADAGVSLTTLTTIDDALEAASAQQKLPEGGVAIVKDWIRTLR